MCKFFIWRTVQENLLPSSKVLSQFTHQHVDVDKCWNSTIIRSLVSLHSRLFPTQQFDRADVFFWMMRINVFHNKTNWYLDSDRSDNGILTLVRLVNTVSLINYKYPDIFHETNKWFLKLLPFNSLYPQQHNADTHTPQSHLLHPHFPKPTPNFSTRSTQNEPLP